MKSNCPCEGGDYTLPELRQQYDTMRLDVFNSRMKKKWREEKIPALIYCDDKYDDDINICFLPDSAPDLDFVVYKSSKIVELVQVTLALDPISYPYKKCDGDKVICRVLTADIDSNAEKIAQLKRQRRSMRNKVKRMLLDEEIKLEEQRIQNPPPMMSSMKDIKDREVKLIKKAIEKKTSRLLNDPNNKNGTLLVSYYIDGGQSYNYHFDMFDEIQLDDLKIYCRNNSNKLSKKYNQVVLINLFSLCYSEPKGVRPILVWGNI